jgi:hypothetical protein
MDRDSPFGLWLLRSERDLVCLQGIDGNPTQVSLTDPAPHAVDPALVTHTLFASVGADGLEATTH